MNGHDALPNTSGEQFPNGQPHQHAELSNTLSKKLRILLAEDDTSNQLLVIHILASQHHIDIARNGLEVIDLIHSNTYDVVLMDIQMPYMDGIKATHYIRSNIERERQPRIIALTARSMPGERDHFLAIGMDAYLSKPYSRESLLKIVHDT